jgi:hypothetical protein
VLIALLAILGVNLILVVQLRAGGATVGVAAHDEEIEQLLGPFRESAAVRRDPSATPEDSSPAPPIGARASARR